MRHLRLTRAHIAAAAAAAALGIAAAGTLAAQPAQAQTAGGSCTVKLRYGEAHLSYSSQASPFGAVTHVALATTGDGYDLVWDHVYTAGRPVARGIVGQVTGPRAFTFRTGWLPVRASFGVVDAVPGSGAMHGSCQT